MCEGMVRIRPLLVAFAALWANHRKRLTKRKQTVALFFARFRFQVDTDQIPQDTVSPPPPPPASSPGKSVGSSRR